MKTPVLCSAFSLLFFLSAQAQEVPSTRPAPAAENHHPAIRQRPWLGVSLSSEEGKLRVAAVASDSPAEKSGVKVDDIVVRVGDLEVNGAAAALTASVLAGKPGDTLRLTLNRSGETVTCDAILGGLVLPPELAADSETSPRSTPLIEAQLRHLGPEVELYPFEKVEPSGFLPRFQRMRPLRSKPFDFEAAPPPGEPFLPEGKPLPSPQAGWSPFDDHQNAGDPPPAEKKPGADEAAVWDMVRVGLSRSLEKEGLDDRVRERVMNALERARTESAERQQRRAALESEAQLLDLKIRTLKERADLIREELKESGE